MFTIVPWLINPNTIYYLSINFPLSFIGQEPATGPANSCVQIMACSCALPFDKDFILLQIIYSTHAYLCPIPRKMAAFFPELWESGFNCLHTHKNSRNSKKATKIYLNEFRWYLKDIELDEHQLVPSKAKLRFSSVLLKQWCARFPLVEGNCANKFSDRMIKQLLNPVFEKLLKPECAVLADQLFASAFGFDKYLSCSSLSNLPTLLNRVHNCY